MRRTAFARAVRSGRLLALLLAAVWSAGCTEPLFEVEADEAARPYIFTQTHDSGLLAAMGVTERQRVALGSAVQIQLPGLPTVWTLATPGAPQLDFTGQELVENEGRFRAPCRAMSQRPQRNPLWRNCPQAIFQFDFVAVGEGRTAVVLTGSPPSPFEPSAGYTLLIEVVP